MHRNAAYCLRQYGAGYAYAAFATYGYACRPIGCGRYGRFVAYCLRQYGAGYAYAACATYGYACRPIGNADTGSEY